MRKTAHPTSGRLIMQRNEVHHVSTAERVVKDLGVSEDLVQGTALGLAPEDGVIWIYGPNDDDGSWPHRIEKVKLLLEKYHRVPPIESLTPAPRCSWRHRIRKSAVLTGCVPRDPHFRLRCRFWPASFGKHGLDPAIKHA
ncbi:hypothetical protein [Mesorhizobium sp. M0674]|uniref:hypothetical protein n=1 Tax=unclassified Mesorhizobium TaxID=325217 RepID=UPI003337C4E6